VHGIPPKLYFNITFSQEDAKSRDSNTKSDQYLKTGLFDGPSFKHDKIGFHA
jgi:hypothetical protein